MADLRVEPRGRSGMNELILRQGYWRDVDARRAFQKFLIEIHGLDLARWEAAGFWDHERYLPFSFFDEGGAVVASLCVFSLDLVVDGRPCRAGQLSGVGTDPRFRRQGLNRQLTEVALASVAEDHDFVFLFAAEEALAFYAACGFQIIEESQTFLEVEGREPRAGLLQVDVSDEQMLSSLAEAAHRRAPVSHRLGALNPRLLLFHVLYTLTDSVFFLPALDVYVLLKHEGDRLTVFDVIGETVPTFAELYPFLARLETREVLFGFDPDLLEPSGLEWRPMPETLCHDRGDFPLRRSSFIFPYTSHA